MQVRRWIVAGASMLALASGAMAAGKGVYERALLTTSAKPVEPGLQGAIDALRAAVAKKDRKAVYAMIAPKFEVQRDLGGLISAKMSARKKFDTMMPGWGDLTALAQGKSWGPIEPDGKLQCGPAPLTDADEKKVFKAAKQRDSSDENTYYEWVYADVPGVAVHEKPDVEASKIADLKVEAVRALGGGKSWTKISLPEGTIGYVKSDDLFALLSPRLCFAKVKSKWMIAAYVGGGD